MQSTSQTRSQTSARTPARRSRSRFGLALAGGGPLGGMYELGALCALEEVVEGFDATAMTRYVGVSAGAFLSAALASGVGPRRLVRLMFRPEGQIAAFDASVYATPALGELARRAVRVPTLLLDAAWQLARQPWSPDVRGALLQLARGLPVGALDNEPIRRWIADLLRLEGVPDDFSEFGKRLMIVATDLHTGTAAIFGRGALRDVPVSVAVQASSAIPGVYLPVRVGDRLFVDGALARTMHASALLDDDIGLLFAINPLVPVHTPGVASAHCDALLAQGLPGLLSQTVRTMLHTRLRAAQARYRVQYPRSDIVFLEPRPDEYAMFFNDSLDIDNRQTICDLGYRATLRDLAARQRTLARMLRRHGLRLRTDLLVDGATDFWDRVDLRPPHRIAPVTRRLQRALARAEAVLQAG